MSCSNGSVNIFAVSFGDFGKMLQSGRIFNFNKSSARRILPLSVDIEFLKVVAHKPPLIEITSTSDLSIGRFGESVLLLVKVSKYKKRRLDH